MKPPIIQSTLTSKHISAFTTTRQGGMSLGPFDSFNLSYSVGDKPTYVAENRKRLMEAFKVPEEPLWLKQTHGSHIIYADEYEIEIEADAIISRQPNQVCVIQTADCLPILIASHDEQPAEVAAIHGGWRSLSQEIIQKTINKMKTPPSFLSAWLGPCISQNAFEVGFEVKELFCRSNNSLSQYFNSVDKKYQADLYGIARELLLSAGLRDIKAANLCTYTQSDCFFSYRREGLTGRMASLIWINGSLKPG